MKSNDFPETIISSGDIGRAIKRRRVTLGMSQERLAEILSVSYQQVQRYENGSNKLNVENIQLVAAALAVPPSFFFMPETNSVADPGASYLGEDEQELFRLFRSIRSLADRDLVLGLIRLAARKQ